MVIPQDLQTMKARRSPNGHIFFPLQGEWSHPYQVRVSSLFPNFFARKKGRAKTMGRAKLQIKYRENSRARLATYMTRMKGLKKKASELSVLCGVDVLLASFSPELNTVQFWPEQDTWEFHRIRERYCHYRSESEKRRDCSVERHYGNNESMPCLPMPSPSILLVLEEKAAMDIKLKEVRERLCFLRALSGDASSEEQPLQLMVSPLQQEERPLQEVQAMVPPSLPSLEQASPFCQPRPALAAFTMEDWSWCDSLVDYDG